MIKNLIYIAILLLFPVLSYAQVIISGGGEIVAKGTSVIYVGGDWTNNNTSDSGFTAESASMVYFKSSNTQTIGGSKTTTFTRIDVDNTSSSGFQLNTDIKVLDTLVFVKGIIHANSNTVYFMGTGRSVSATVNKFIDGLISRTGYDDFRFDIGEGTKYAPIRTFGISSSTFMTMTASYHFSTPPDAASVNTPLVKVSDVEYWHVNSGVSARLRIYWKDGAQSGIKTLDTTLRIAQYHGSIWDDEPASILGTSTLSKGSITTTAALSLSDLYLTFGSTNNIKNPLPIELLSFTAQCSDKDVLVEWTTASEENNNYFTILRSEDAEHFEEIAQIPGAGNSNEVLNYSYRDWNAAGNNYYYKLVQTDYNGQSEEFEPVFVNCENTEETALQVLYDNDEIYAYLSNAQSGAKYQMLVIDHTGRVVLEELQYVNARNYYRIPTDGLAAGLYSIIYYSEQGDVRLNAKFLVR